MWKSSRCVLARRDRSSLYDRAVGFHEEGHGGDRQDLAPIPGALRSRRWLAIPAALSAISRPKPPPTELENVRRSERCNHSADAYRTFTGGKLATRLQPSGARCVNVVTPVGAGRTAGPIQPSNHRTIDRKGNTVKNPWIHKNPFMSMWLSGANSAFSAARGVAMAESRRQGALLMAESARQAARFWSGAWTSGPNPKPAKRRRRAASKSAVRIKSTR